MRKGATASIMVERLRPGKAAPECAAMRNRCDDAREAQLDGPPSRRWRARRPPLQRRNFFGAYWKLPRDPENTSRRAPLGTIQHQAQLRRLTRVEPRLGPVHEPHTLQQPSGHVFQAAEQLPDRATT